MITEIEQEKKKGKRRWFLTINNYEDKGYSKDTVIKILQELPLKFFCLSLEVATTGTPHMHVFIMPINSMSFERVKRIFPNSGAHIEFCKKSSSAIRNYIMKGGYWETTEKYLTVVEGSYYEEGIPPTEQQEKAGDKQLLIEAVQDGRTTREIVLDMPKYAFRSKDIDILRQNLMTEEYRENNRTIEVHYFYGASGAGKTREIYRRFKPYEVCRITNYPLSGVKFDAYIMQDVLVFEEFRSQIPIADMLSYLDIYPIMLPARYSDKVACYTKVFVISNIPPDKQYEEIQKHEPDSFLAFLRRLTSVVEFTADRKQIKHDVTEYCKYEWQKTKLRWAKLGKEE